MYKGFEIIIEPNKEGGFMLAFQTSLLYLQEALPKLRASEKCKGCNQGVS